jgi:protein tyrosine/serine phosphatase
MKSHTPIQRTQRAALASALICAFFLPALAGGERKPAHSNPAVNIENFGQVNDHIYRGSQPNAENYRQLASIGVKTVVDLRGDSERNAKTLAEEAGLQYINLPLADKQYPQADAAEKFLEIVKDEANWPVYVHCAGGRHRTGSMIAVYRMSVDGWAIDHVDREMKDYDFYTSGGHSCYKNFVFNYYRDLQARNNMPVVAEPKDAVNTEQRERF